MPEIEEIIEIPDIQIPQIKQSTQPVIRTAQPHNIDAIIKISIECFGEIGTFSAKETEKYIINNLSYVLTEESNVIGFLLCGYKDGIINLAVIGITEAHRGKGYGRRLINQCFEDNKGVRLFSLHVDVNNAPALGLYKSMGFKIVQFLRHYYEDDSDAYFMIKKVNDEEVIVKKDDEYNLNDMEMNYIS
jgi:ribosomal protein S18 acetylase RimI-like enzyme